MRQRQGRYGYDDLLAIARGDLTGAGNAKLPFPPMLMFDRISEVRDDGGAYGRGYQRAELDIDPQLWFFQSPSGQGSMPPCLGLDALWQMLGFYLWWAGGEGRGRALGLGDFESNGQILPDAVKVTYQIDIRRVFRGRLTMGIADGLIAVDDKVICRAKDLRVGLFQTPSASSTNTDAKAVLGAM